MFTLHPDGTVTPPIYDRVVIRRDHVDELFIVNGEPHSYRAHDGAPWVRFEGPSTREWLDAQGVEWRG